MGDDTKISWSDATWNPTTGCSKVSAGCENCYAIRVGARIQHLDAYEGTVADGDWTGRLNLVADRLDQPLRWRKPRRVFVNSMSDLFHPRVPFTYVDRVWDVMERAPQHVFQILTKRPERMRRYVRERDDARPLPNVWLGVSVETQEWADRRLSLLAATPARVRFVSCEPLLGPLDLRRWIDKDAIREAGGSWTSEILDWVIVGGESGRGARRMDLTWAERIVAHCRARSVPVHVKQLGVAYGPHHAVPTSFPEGLRVREFPANA